MAFQERMIFATDYNNIKEAIAGGFAADTVNEKIDEIVGKLKEIASEQPEDGDPGEFFDNFTIFDEIEFFEKLRMKRKKRWWLKIRSEAQRRADLKYKESARAKKKQKEYRESEIGKQKIKEAVKKYSQTENGREKRREAVRRFRQRQKIKGSE